MRHPFSISIVSAECKLYHDYVWRELRFAHARPLKRCFAEILIDKQKELAALDKRDWSKLDESQKNSYKQEARAIMFELRDFPYGIDQILPAACRIGLPNILRTFQSSTDTSKGLAGGYHIAVLWNKTVDEIFAVGTLEKTKNHLEAEVSCWKHPRCHTEVIFDAMTNLMRWSQDNCGYRHFIAHIEETTQFQRGNPSAVALAEKLGFSVTGHRDAEAPNGNGKDTLILTAPNWGPRPR